jgi:hypothetical protein
MPIAYDIDRARGLVRTSCSGQVMLPEVLAHFDQLQQDPQRSSRLDVLLDLRLLSTPPDAPKLRRVANRIGRVTDLRFGRCAIVADRDLVFGLSRMFEAFARAYFDAIQVFRDPAAAEAWVQRAPNGPQGREA